MRVPVTGKVVGTPERGLMMDSILHNCGDSYGPYVPMFEKALADFIGTKHVITCNSGSSALLLAFMALTSEKLGDKRIKPGDEVITVAAGFPSTINPILLAGCVPVFVDVTIPEYNINVNQLEMARSDKCKVVVIAHTLGRPFNIAAVRDFCTAHNLWLIEDCCDALGSMVDGRHVGLYGDLATLSFYPAHHITTGEGGAVFTNSGRLRVLVEAFRDWGRDCFCVPGRDNTCKKRFDWQLGNLPRGYDHKYIYSELGFNLKLTDVAAACGVAQMERLPDFIVRRVLAFDYLRHHLGSLSQHLHLPELDAGMVPFGFPLTCKMADVRNALIRHLQNCEVDTRLLFGGNLTKQPYMVNRNWRSAAPLLNTNLIMQDTFWIGCWPGLTEEMLAHSVASIKEFFA